MNKGASARLTAQQTTGFCKGPDTPITQLLLTSGSLFPDTRSGYLMPVWAWAMVKIIALSLR